MGRSRPGGKYGRGGAGDRGDPHRASAAAPPVEWLAGLVASLGTAGYWLAGIAALYAGCRLFGLRLDAAAVIVAYGTGYVLTRRTLPLAGAGIIEFLLTLALHWGGEPISLVQPSDGHRARVACPP